MSKTYEYSDCKQHPGSMWNIQYMNPEGLKFDDGKTPLSLLPPEAVEQIGLVLKHGAEKYDAHNWRKGMKWSRLASALLRHVFAWLKGEDIDTESGLPHLAHAGCCIMFLLSFAETNTGEDDRYKPCQ